MVFPFFFLTCTRCSSPATCVQFKSTAVVRQRTCFATPLSWLGQDSCSRYKQSGKYLVWVTVRWSEALAGLFMPRFSTHVLFIWLRFCNIAIVVFLAERSRRLPPPEFVQCPPWSLELFNLWVCVVYTSMTFVMNSTCPFSPLNALISLSSPLSPS